MPCERQYCVEARAAGRDRGAREVVAVVVAPLLSRALRASVPWGVLAVSRCSRVSRTDSARDATDGVRKEWRQRCGGTSHSRQASRAHRESCAQPVGSVCAVELRVWLTLQRRGAGIKVSCSSNKLVVTLQVWDARR